MSFEKNIQAYILSGHALLHIDTHEVDRAKNKIIEVATEASRNVLLWSVSTGWTDTHENRQGEAHEQIQVEEYLSQIIESDKKTIFIMKHFGPYLNYETYQSSNIIISLLDELKPILHNQEKTIIFIGPVFKIPTELKYDITQISFNLPNTEQIQDIIKNTTKNIEKNGEKFTPDLKLLPEIIDACKGMTTQQIEDRIALTINLNKDFNNDAVKTLIREKAGILKASGLLKYIEPPVGGLSNIGGYEEIKKHILLDKPCFTYEAKKFGVEFPRGLIFAGIPGCGKTALASAIASEFNYPLISLDVGCVMSKYVGDSEANIREAIKIIESISPAVLLVDEIEKGFGGVGDLDGGASKRVFGTLLSWLQDRQSCVYVIATANQVQSLPPELLRTGRFDAIFGLDLPLKEEREEIFKIHLLKRNRDPKNYNIPKLSNNTDGYVGSDIEQIIKLGLKIAFASNEKLSDEHLILASNEIIPLSKMELEKIRALRNWCTLHAKAASIHKPNHTTNNRKISLN